MFVLMLEIRMFNGLINNPFVFHWRGGWVVVVIGVVKCNNIVVVILWLN